jgi:hypothetical protein
MGARASSADAEGGEQLRLGASRGAEHPREQRPDRAQHETETEDDRRRARAPALAGHEPSIFCALSAAGVPGRRVMILWSASRALV